MQYRITVPSISVGVSYTSPRPTRLYAAIIITGEDGRALSGKDFADHLQPLSTLAYASYIESYAVKPTTDNPDGFERLNVFLSELPETAAGVVVVGYILGNEVDNVTLGHIRELVVTIDSLEDGDSDTYTPFAMNDEDEGVTHASKILCEIRRDSHETWELRPVDRSVRSNEVINRRYGILLDL